MQPAPTAEPEPPRTAAATQSPAVAPSIAEDPGDWRLRLRGGGDEGGAIDVPYVADAVIHLDGQVEEPAWRGVAGFDNMRVTDPDTLADATYATVTRFLYTDRGLYVAASMEQPPDTLVSRLSARDQYINRDQFGVALDSSGNGLYGYWFSVNLGGSVQDGKVLPEYTLTEQWDGRGRRRRTGRQRAGVRRCSYPGR